MKVLFFSVSLEKFKRHELEDGYYIIYRVVSNGYGGLRPANIMFFHGEELIDKEITDTLGNFVDFPETIPGEWTNKIARFYYDATDFITPFSEKYDDSFGECKQLSLG